MGEKISFSFTCIPSWQPQFCLQPCIMWVFSSSMEKESESLSVMSDSVRPYRRQPTRPRHPWDSPGKNTGVGCHFLLQCMKVKSESEVAQSCPTLIDPILFFLYSYFRKLHWYAHEKAMAPHSSTLAWKIPWTEEPGWLQSMGSQRVRRDWTGVTLFFPALGWIHTCKSETKTCFSTELGSNYMKTWKQMWKENSTFPSKI